MCWQSMGCKSLLDRVCKEAVDQRKAAETSLQDIGSNRNLDLVVVDATQDCNRVSHNSSGL